MENNFSFVSQVTISVCEQNVRARHSGRTAAKVGRGWFRDELWRSWQQTPRNDIENTAEFTHKITFKGERIKSHTL